MLDWISLARMGFGNNKVRRVVEEDRLSSLPDELIHKILSCFDMKFAVQTSLLSSKWKLLWTSMPSLSFSSEHFGPLPKFAKFVTHVLSHRNHHIDLISVKLHFCGATNQAFVREIVNYAFSHNVQELTIISYHIFHLANYPPCLFSSQSLKHFTLARTRQLTRVTIETPFDFPALTTLHLSRIELCGDLFSKCVNLHNLTLEHFHVGAVKVFDIITPRLSNLKLINGDCSEVNVIAPQLEKLTIYHCFRIGHLNAPPGLRYLRYSCIDHPQLSIDRFHFLNEVAISLSMYWSTIPYEEEDARKSINMLQKLHSVRYLTLDVGIVECISSFPELLSPHPSPFSNLICLTIAYHMKKDAYKLKISSEARNFFLENSPNATLIMELTKVGNRS